MANSFLTRLKLIDHVDFVLDTSSNQLAAQLSRNIESHQSDLSDLFSSSNHEYKGSVSANGFTLRKRKRLFEVYQNFCLATGSFRDTGTDSEQVTVSVEINAFSGSVRIMLIALAVFYGIGFCVTLVVGLMHDPRVLFALIGLIVHGAIMFGILYLIIRKSIRRMKYDLERDLFYIVHGGERRTH